MPEIPDVLPDTTIAVEWGNDIRDRTLQRYATAAARASNHTTPEPGDLSFLEDTGRVEVYFGGSWRSIDFAHEVRDHLYANGPLTFPNEIEPNGPGGTGLELELAIPADWNTWDLEAHLTGFIWNDSATDTTELRYQANFLVAGTTETQVVEPGGNPPTSSGYAGNFNVQAWEAHIVGFLDALAHTGLVTVEFQAAWYDHTTTALRSITAWAVARRRS